MARGNLAPVLRRLCALAVRPGTTDDGSMLERFAVNGEEAAFQALVERHGPLVLGVCRRVLGDEHEAEDAFQATFLVLARRAGSIRQRSSVASWLYGVALRVASKSRVNAARRRTGQLPAEEVPAAPNMDLAVRELRAVLDEELNRLAEKYRAPLVLCYLEGKTKDEAAAELGWPTGTVSGRLARARDLLRDRLTRRGLALSTALFVTLLSETAAPAALPVALASAATAAAAGLAAGKPLAGIVSTTVAHLVEGVLREMFLTKLKFATVVLAAFLLIGGGAGTWMLRTTEAAPIGENLPPSKAQTAPKAVIARSRIFDSAQKFVVYQLIDGWPQKVLGTTPTANRRGITIPAGATWAVEPKSGLAKGGQGGAGGIGGFGGIRGGGGFAGPGGMGFWQFQGLPFPQVGNGAAPANQGQPQAKLPRLADKEIQALVVEIKRRSIAGLLLRNREFTDDNLARLKGLPSLQTLVLRNTTVTEKGLRTLKDFPNLRYLVLEGDVLKPSGVAWLADCKGLRTLDLRGSNVTDELVANLKEVQGLKTLRLKYTALTEAGLKTVANMQSLNSQDGLENLELVGEAITDAGIAHLKALGGLNALRLHLTEITDVGLAHLKDISSLRLLDIDCGEDASPLPTFRMPNLPPGQKMQRMGNDNGQVVHLVPTGNVTDKGLQHLKEMKGLTELALCSDHLTDAGLEELSGLTALKRLRLAGLGLTEKGLAALKPLKDLQGLELWEGTFSPAGVATLRGLPKLRVLYLPLTTSKETGSRYIRGLAPKTKTWFGKPWLAMQSPMAGGMNGGGGGVGGGGGFGGAGGFPGPGR